MAEQLPFGIIKLPNVLWTPLVEHWRLFEMLRFERVWDCDHFINPFNPPEPWYEGWTSLAYLALIGPLTDPRAPGGNPTRPTTAPIGLASFAHDFRPIRKFAERDHTNIASWGEFDRGSHWADHDAPDLLFGDICRLSRRFR